MIQYGKWYTIPQFKAYEFIIIDLKTDPNLNTLNYVPILHIDSENKLAHTVRSFKMPNVYPYGYYLPYSHTTKGKESLYYEMTNFEDLRKRLTVTEIIQLIIDYPEYAKIMPDIHTIVGNTRNSVLPWERSDRQKRDPAKREVNSAGSLFRGLIKNKEDI